MFRFTGYIHVEYDGAGRPNNLHKCSAELQATKGVEQYPTTCKNNYGLSLQGETLLSGHDTWLSSYDPNNDLDNLDF